MAPARYDDLTARRPEAFADQAHWLAAGDELVTARQLARFNLEVRDTPRSRRPVAQGPRFESRG